MFKTAFLATLFALGLAAAIIGIGLLKAGPEDVQKYQQLLESSAGEKKNDLSTYSQQRREKVTKEIWFQEKHPLYCRIQSAHSSLFFFHEDKNTIKVMEEMQKVSGTMQEELFYLLPDGREVIEKEKGKLMIRGADHSVDASTPGLTPMQFVRYFEAEKASYYYNTQLFTGENVKLWKYRLPGHTPPLSLGKHSPLMIGTADSVEFTFRGHEPRFTAHHLKATFDPKKGAV